MTGQLRRNRIPYGPHAMVPQKSKLLLLSIGCQLGKIGVFPTDMEGGHSSELAEKPMTTISRHCFGDDSEESPFSISIIEVLHLFCNPWFENRKIHTRPGFSYFVFLVLSLIPDAEHERGLWPVCLAMQYRPGRVCLATEIALFWSQRDWGRHLNSSYPNCLGSFPGSKFHEKIGMQFLQLHLYNFNCNFWFAARRRDFLAWFGCRESGC